MLNPKETIIIFGRSMFINEIRDFISGLIKTYKTIGINSFSWVYRTDYIFFYDDFEPKLFDDNQTVITDIRLFQNKKTRAYGVLKDIKNKELYLVNKSETEFTKDDMRLNFYFHTPTMAMNWAYKKGFKNVVLAGIELSKDTRHFDSTYLANWTDNKRIRARKHLENICTKYLNIYQLDKNSTLNIEKIDIKDLIKC